MIRRPSVQHPYAALLLLGVLTTLVLAACTGASSTPWEAEDQLKAVDGQTWVVWDRLASVSPDAATPNSPSIGSMVHVSGRRTPRGEFVIDSVEVVEAPSRQLASPTQTPPPRVQPTPVRPVPKKKPEHGGGEGD